MDLQGGAGIKGFIDYAPCVATAAGGARLDIEHGCAAPSLKIYSSEP